MKWIWIEKSIRWLDRRFFAFLGLSGRAKMARSLQVVQAVLHKRLNRHYREKHPGHEPLFYDHLATLVLARLFGNKPVGKGAIRFAREQRARVEQALKLLPKELPWICAEVTRALYVKALIDDLDPEGSGKLFSTVNELGVFDSGVGIPEPKEYFEHALRLAQDSGFSGD